MMNKLYCHFQLIGLNWAKLSSIFFNYAHGLNILLLTLDTLDKRIITVRQKLTEKMLLDIKKNYV